MRKLFVSVGLSVACVGVGAQQEPQIWELFDDRLFERAFLQVWEMERPELDALKEVLAACGQAEVLKGGKPRYYCLKEFDRYEMSGYGNAPVARILASTNLAVALLGLSNAKVSDPNVKAIYERYVEVLKTLRKTVVVRSENLTNPKDNK